MKVDVRFDRAFYRPGEPVRAALHLQEMAAGESLLQVCVRITHLAQTLHEVRHRVVAQDGRSPLELAFVMPSDAPRGYGLDVTVTSAAGDTLAQLSAGFDVLHHWTEMPRYGFLSDFWPGRDDAEETVRQLVRYHVNALQFYDWMYRHDCLLAPREPYQDPLGRTLSLQTVRRLIDAAHTYGLASMPYTAVYAASLPFYEEHQEWALYHEDGSPQFFGDSFLAYMDPRPGSPWVQHLLREFEVVLRETAFDGIHLDQYGQPRVAWDASGRRFALEEPLAALIEATAEVVSRNREGGAVVFNAVRNWPVETVAPAAQDLVYIEVWEPYVTFADLHALVVDAQEMGGGKPVVLAAYVHPAWEHNVRLMDAIIFAAGGGRIELGEHGDVLADPYFPNYAPMSSALAVAMRRYYDFAVRYQNVTGPGTCQADEGLDVKLSANGAALDTSPQPGSVWPIVRSGEGFAAINLVNLAGLQQARWDRQVTRAPTLLRDITVHVHGFRGQIERAWLASPDDPLLAARPLDVTIRDVDGQQQVSLTVSSLAYWDLVVLERAT
jgi:dextranase